jgi:hypothetical protein
MADIGEVGTYSYFKDSWMKNFKTYTYDVKEAQRFKLTAKPSNNLHVTCREIKDETIEKTFNCCDRDLVKLNEHHMFMNFCRLVKVGKLRVDPDEKKDLNRQLKAAVRAADKKKTQKQVDNCVGSFQRRADNAYWLCKHYSAGIIFCVKLMGAHGKGRFLFDLAEEWKGILLEEKKADCWFDEDPVIQQAKSAILEALGEPL